jgi:hypothetical protein
MLFSGGRTRVLLQLQNTSADVVACLFSSSLPFFSASYQQPALISVLLQASLRGKGSGAVCFIKATDRK